MSLLERRFTVRVTEDGMAALATVTRASGAIEPMPSHARLSSATSLGEQALRNAMLSAGVVSGIDEVALLELARLTLDPSFERTDVRLASGTAPAPGRAGFVELAFELGLAPGRLNDDGHMNFFDRGLLKTVVAGQVVATVHPPRSPRSGMTVTGQPLPGHDAAAAKLKLGAGVGMDDSGVVRALLDGVVLHQADDRLDVVAQYVHQG